MSEKVNLNVIDLATHKFVVPKREVLKPLDISKWEHSIAYADLMNWILRLNKSVANKAVTANDYLISDKVKRMLAMLEALNTFIDETPAIEQPARFGNQAYRTWFQKFSDAYDDLLDKMLPESMLVAKVELKPYLLDSFGNSTRIDYGTGHELNFVIFSLLLFKIGFIGDSDCTAFVLKVFESYLNLCRKLQVTYRMEPAGSHGVWCLDDHQFLPFLWGSSQLLDSTAIMPSNFPDPSTYDKHYEDYLFLSAIRYIAQVKTGPFAEHSNQLWNISGVPSWSKANQGLIKMYKGEVLCKFPIIQHIVFGSLFQFKPNTDISN